MSAGAIRTREKAEAWSRRSVEIRKRRSELKEELFAGHVHLEQLLDAIPPWAETMKVIDVLLALRRIWRRKAERALLAAGANEFTTLSQLSERQRAALCAHFRTHHPSIWALWATMARRAA